MFYYSKTTAGFYAESVHATMPADAVPVTREQHAELMAGQSAGKVITADADGHPFLAEPPAPGTEQLALQVRSRRDALLLAADRAILWAEDNRVVGLDLLALRAYRQALRDVPQQPGFPTSITWPPSPES